MPRRDESAERIDGIRLVPTKARKRLNERQILDYREHRRELIQWLLNLGKEPSQGEGYATGTVKRRCSYLDRWYRWVWDEEGRYTTALTHDHADEYCKHLAYRDISDTAKVAYQNTLLSYWDWRDGGEWEPEITFTDTSSSSEPRDYLTKDERTAIREAALDRGSAPSYNSVSGDELDRWKIYLSQWFGKPKSEVTKDDFDRANGFKIPSLVCVSLDAGLRPIEVGRAKVSWVDLDNAVLRIPKADSAKNDGNWTVSLRRRTAEMLAMWLRERELYPKYEDTETLWLTRKDTQYNTRSLKYLLRRLCDHAGIKYENRRMTWYAIRHSVGTYMAREEGLAAAQAQLRHKNIQTTARYDQAPVDDRRDALDRMG